jgi:3-oxoacyl-[acyl-carrier-protein] synthase-3
MALTKHRGVKIKGIVNVIPELTEDNLQLTIINKEERVKLVEHTGIRYRRISSLPVKNLFARGIKEAMELTGWNYDEIDVLICVTQTPELSLPSIACQLHGDLGLKQQTICYDINSGCSGYVYGFHTVASILSSISKDKPRALLCCGDVSTHLLSPEDTSTRPIFSDAISVTAIEYNANDNNITARFNLETMGSGQSAIYAELNAQNNKIMRLNGIDVFAYSVKYVPQNIETLIKSAEMPDEMPSLYVFHQANKLINDAISKKLKLTSDMVPHTLEIYGNTASASIPITLCSRLNEMNNWILLSGFGVGFSVASVLVKVSDFVPHKTIEI